jgi:hypothetical protein
MLVSMKVGIYPAREPERAIEIDGALGDGSPFRDRVAALVESLADVRVKV